MIFPAFILYILSFSVIESAIWNIPKEYSSYPKNSTWCFSRGGKWNNELKQCVCYKNYYGNSCEHVRNCRFGSPINHECICAYGWRGETCAEIDCKFGVSIKNNTECVCDNGVGGIYCDACIERYRSPPNCFEKAPQQINKQSIPQCSSNLINYYLNIFLFVLIAIYFTINRIYKRREQQFLRTFNTGPILTPEMEALLLAKNQIHPNLVPCPRYDEALHHPKPAETYQSAEQMRMITIYEEESQMPITQEELPEKEISVRIYSLHV